MSGIPPRDDEVFPSSPEDENEFFPLVQPDRSTSGRRIKFKIVKANYEIFMATLKDINAHVLVPHCLAFMEQVHK